MMLFLLPQATYDDEEKTFQSLQTLLASHPATMVPIYGLEILGTMKVYAVYQLTLNYSTPTKILFQTARFKINSIRLLEQTQALGLSLTAAVRGLMMAAMQLRERD